MYLHIYSRYIPTSTVHESRVRHFLDDRHRKPTDEDLLLMLKIKWWEKNGKNPVLSVKERINTEISALAVVTTLMHTAVRWRTEVMSRVDTDQWDGGISMSDDYSRDRTLRNISHHQWQQLTPVSQCRHTQERLTEHHRVQQPFTQLPLEKYCHN